MDIRSGRDFRQVFVLPDMGFNLRQCWQVVIRVAVRLYDLLNEQSERTTALIYRKSIRFYGLHGLFSRQMQTGTVALLAVLFLAAYLLFYLVHL